MTMTPRKWFIDFSFGYGLPLLLIAAIVGVAYKTEPPSVSTNNLDTLLWGACGSVLASLLAYIVLKTFFIDQVLTKKYLEEKVKPEVVEEIGQRIDDIPSNIKLSEESELSTFRDVLYDFTQNQNVSFEVAEQIQRFVVNEHGDAESTETFSIAPLQDGQVIHFWRFHRGVYRGTKSSIVSVGELEAYYIEDDHKTPLKVMKLNRQDDRIDYVLHLDPPLMGKPTQKIEICTKRRGVFHNLISTKRDSGGCRPY
ncbi:MAG: hypothetical protein F6K16_29690, partial [Symploca sp. SIO2B6]|nr:hypothetical protein [Symploca sp. SIO2B6]